MEPAKIDWETIDSVFVEEDYYENINAPKWVDFSAPDQPVDDEAWFCKPDCKHPKTVEDFFKLTPSSSKRPSSGKVCEIRPLGDRTKREATLKRRGIAQPSVSSNIDSKFNEDSENQNPNLSTPPIQQRSKSMKTMMKSSSEKKQQIDDSINPVQNDKTPRLKSTLSARNLFAGRDILNHITEFCNELKKMALRAKERENVENSSVRKSPASLKKELVKGVSDEDLGDLDGRDKERKPLLEVSKAKSEALEKSNGTGKLRRKKRADEAENFPKSLELKNIRRKDEESLMQIRTNPPSPQCFSAVHGSAKPTPTKASKSRLMERGVHQEVEQSNKQREVRKEELVDKLNNGRSVSIVAEKEARTMDVFWFLKPCTLSS